MIVGVMLKDISVAVDAFHFKNHVKTDKQGRPTRCSIDFNPHDRKEFEPNTEAAEQLFSKLRKFKYAMRHMNDASHKFFILRIVKKMNTRNARHQASAKKKRDFEAEKGGD
eukprot:g3280.t1